MNKDRTDHEIRREPPDERPTRPIPGVHNLYVHASFRTSTNLHQPPHDVHASADTPHVPIPNFAGRAIDRHLGHPPGRILEETTTERPPCSHLDQSIVEETNPAVMGKDGRPTGDGARGREDARE